MSAPDPESEVPSAGVEDLLIPLEDYLRAGVHIGTSSGMDSMKPFIYRVRSDGLYVLDVRKTDERIRTVAKLLARQEPESIAVCSVRTYGQYPAERFCSTIGATCLTGRFIPGTFTNPNLGGAYQHIEPSIIIITDPHIDKQALMEANEVGVPVVALGDTDNTTHGVDIVVPCNNKGRNSLATVFYLIARQTLRERGELPPEADAELRVDQFRSPRGRRLSMEEGGE